MSGTRMTNLASALIFPKFARWKLRLMTNFGKGR
jgi:hypothetical protein